MVLKRDFIPVQGHRPRILAIKTDHEVRSVQRESYGTRTSASPAPFRHPASAGETFDNTRMFRVREAQLRRFHGGTITMERCSDDENGKHCHERHENLAYCVIEHLLLPKLRKTQLITTHWYLKL